MKTVTKKFVESQVERLSEVRKNYIELDSIQSESEEFRQDFKKVVLCIKSATNIGQLETSRNLAYIFMRKHDIVPMMTNEKISPKKMERYRKVEMYRGYIEYTLEETAKKCYEGIYAY